MFGKGEIKKWQTTLLMLWELNQLYTRRLQVSGEGNESRKGKYIGWVKWKQKGRWGVCMCVKKRWELATGRLEGRWWWGVKGSFIAKALFNILRKLPPLHASDFVRRIPLPLQTPNGRSTTTFDPTTPCVLQQMRHLSPYCNLTQHLTRLRH